MEHCSFEEFQRLKTENETLNKRLLEVEAQLNGDTGINNQPTYSRQDDRELLATYQEDFKGFVYAVIHDVRSPLANVRGLAAELDLILKGFDQFKSGFPTELSPDQNKKLTVALHEDFPALLGHMNLSISKMDRLMDCLVALSQVVHAELEFSTVDPDAIVNGILKKMSQDLREKACTVELKALPHLHADPLAIERILTCLISNSLKFLINEKPGRIKIFGETETSCNWITVADNGRGIAEKDLDQIFRPFRRAGNLDVPGNGMGLAVAKALVGRHFGRITCGSTPGIGTEFTITFPKEFSRPFKNNKPLRAL